MKYFEIRKVLTIRASESISSSDSKLDHWIPTMNMVRFRLKSRFFIKTAQCITNNWPIFGKWIKDWLIIIKNSLIYHSLTNFDIIWPILTYAIFRNQNCHHSWNLQLNLIPKRGISLLIDYENTVNVWRTDFQSQEIQRLNIQVSDF